MDAVLTIDDVHSSGHGRPAKFSKSWGKFKTPSPFGWRTDALDRPQFRNQLIRRLSSDLFTASYAYIVEDKKAKTEKTERDNKLEKIKNEFNEHAAKWQKDTEFDSSVSDIILHPSYLRIIGMGEVVIPLIISELHKHPLHWFKALEAITGVNPIPSEDRGRIKRMVNHWIDWARKEQLVK